MPEAMSDFVLCPKCSALAFWSMYRQCFSCGHCYHHWSREEASPTDLLVVAQGRITELERILTSLDCRYSGGGLAELSGSHCPPGNPCDRCIAERRIRSHSTCLWVMCPDEAGTDGWYPACRQEPWIFPENHTPWTNGMRFCPFCGNPLEGL